MVLPWSGSDCCMPRRPIGTLNSLLYKANLPASLWLAAFILPFRSTTFTSGVANMRSHTHTRTHDHRALLWSFYPRNVLKI